MRTVRAQSEEGASAVEFALVLPMLVMLLLGMMEFGLLFNAYLAITHAAREGARFAAVHSADTSLTAEVQSLVVDRAYPLSVAKGLTVTGPTQGTDPLGTVYEQVTVAYPFTLRIPYSVAATFTLNSTARMRKE